MAGNDNETDHPHLRGWADSSSLGGLTEAIGLDVEAHQVDPFVGSVVDGIRILRLVGQGGMARVYEGLQDKPKRSVAIKFMRPGILSAKMLGRFEQEVECLGRLQHPAIAHIYSMGFYVIGDSRVPYFVMEFVRDGQSLTEYIEKHKCDLRRRLELFKAVCEAVAHAHEQGVIHRDLKPANILVGGSGYPKVIDFGVARASGSELMVRSDFTEIGELVGTLQYMSPEQVDANPDQIDARTDVYALGLILYEMLERRPPYVLRRRAVLDAVRVIKEESPGPFRNTGKGLGGRLAGITERCLCKDKCKRYSTAAELAGEVAAVLGGWPDQGREVGESFWRAKWSPVLVLVVGCLTLGAALLTFAAPRGAVRNFKKRESDSRVEGEGGKFVDRKQAGGSLQGAAMPLVTNSIGMRLRLMPAGSFIMGDKFGGNCEVPHEVAITKGFYLGVTEVTNRSWKRIMGAVQSRWTSGELPAERVRWGDAVRFCKLLSELPEEASAGRHYRLPTEAEWEYACRAGTSTRYAFGDELERLDAYAWFDLNSKGVTHPVGKKLPNDWGLFDMHGNVWEWCSDLWRCEYPEQPVVDPVGPSSGKYGVTRGGGCGSHAGGCRSAVRGRATRSIYTEKRGFRVAMEIARPGARGGNNDQPTYGRPDPFSSQPSNPE